MIEVVLEIVGRSLIWIFSELIWIAGEFLIEFLYALWPKHKPVRTQVMIAIILLSLIGSSVLLVNQLHIWAGGFFAITVLSFVMLFFQTATGRKDIRQRRLNQRDVKRAKRTELKRSNQECRNRLKTGFNTH